MRLLVAALQAASHDPRYQWAASTAFSHYMLGQYDAALSWAREALYLNPNHLQVLALRVAALARLGRLEEAAKARDILLDHYPDFTVERHLRNFRWKNPDDIAHYCEGLVTAGVPYGTITLVKRAADS